MSSATRLALDVQGMSCGHCVAAVRSALAELDGVQLESVAVGHATVAIDSTRATPATVVEAIRDAGYEAQVRDVRN